MVEKIVGMVARVLKGNAPGVVPKDTVAKKVIKETDVMDILEVMVTMFVL